MTAGHQNCYVASETARNVREKKASTDRGESCDRALDFRESMAAASYCKRQSVTEVRLGCRRIDHRRQARPPSNLSTGWPRKSHRHHVARSSGAVATALHEVRSRATSKRLHRPAGLR